jgi:flavin-dependent dehydrogenase
LVPEESAFDVIVIGGGPAGASAASVAAQAGHSVVLLERDEFPRFHIGESLIPGVMPFLDELGVLASVRDAGFVEKYAAEFVTPDRSFQRRYVFADSLTPEAGLAYQVERAHFDAILLSNASSCGVSVRQAQRVVAVEELSEEIQVTVVGADGGRRQLRCGYLIDASGQHSLLAGKLGLRQMDPALRNIAVYGHFGGITRCAGAEGGDISIVLDPEGWWWVIPLRDDVTSVGFVAPRAAFDGRPDGNWLAERLARTPVLQERFGAATSVRSVMVASDYSYTSTQLVGERWLLAGDAAAFLDPVFSTGVFIGVASGVRAGKAVVAARNDASARQASFDQYRDWLADKLTIYGELVRGFYHPEFVDLLMHPTDNMRLREAVTSALSGYADHPDVAWRLRAFLNAVRANKDLELCPRLPGRREAAERLASLSFSCSD